MTPAENTADRLGLIGCHSCSLVCRLPAVEDADLLCPRCTAPMHRRKPDSLIRTWAFVLTAALLYVPANTLPMMQTTTVLGTRSDTIMSGVLVLWQSGSWDLAIIVFVASVLVPVLKIVVLMVLLVSVHRRWNWGQLERARLYRFIEGIGRWSMLDIFVVALLIALVRFQGLSQVNAGAGAVAFAAVAILTMLASRSFDPRFIWDTPRRPETTA
jgi:paraquat-inducible protein A